MRLVQPFREADDEQVFVEQLGRHDRGDDRGWSGPD